MIISGSDGHKRTYIPPPTRDIIDSEKKIQDVASACCPLSGIFRISSHPYSSGPVSDGEREGGAPGGSYMALKQSCRSPVWALCVCSGL